MTQAQKTREGTRPITSGFTKNVEFSNICLLVCSGVSFSQTNPSSNAILAPWPFTPKVKIKAQNGSRRFAVRTAMPKFRFPSLPQSMSSPARAVGSKFRCITLPSHPLIRKGPSHRFLCCVCHADFRYERRRPGDLKKYERIFSFPGVCSQNPVRPSSQQLAVCLVGSRQDVTTMGSCSISSSPSWPRSVSSSALARRPPWRFSLYGSRWRFSNGNGHGRGGTAAIVGSGPPCGKCGHAGPTFWPWSNRRR